MKELKAVCVALIIATLIVLTGVGGRYLIEHPEHNEPIRDTVYVRDTVYDTIPYYYPVPKDSTVINYITVELPIADDKEDNFLITNDSDSTTVVLPITQKTYTDDSTYKAYISGYMISLDSLLLTRRTETIIKTIPCPDYNNKRWSVDVHIGYGLTVSSTPQFIPYIGIGLSYKLKLFNF